MSLVIALALLVAFTWVISRQEDAEQQGWAGLTSPRPERVVVRQVDGKRS